MSQAPIQGKIVEVDSLGMDAAGGPGQKPMLKVKVTKGLNSTETLLIKMRSELVSCIQVGHEYEVVYWQSGGDSIATGIRSL
jgi:hypothetical protein